VGPALGVDVSDWGKIKTHAERGLRAANLSQEREGILRYRLGVASLELGDLLRAEQQLLRYLQLAQSAAALEPLLAPAQERLGEIHRLLKRPGREAEAFTEAARRYEADGKLVDALRCRLEVVRTALWAGRADAARPDLLRVLAGLPLVEAPTLATDAALAYALYLSLVGRRQASMTLCMALLDAPPLAAIHRAEVSWLLAENALAMGERDVAQLHGAIAHYHGVQAWFPPQMERIESLTRRLASAGGPR